ncbi:MAG: exodeoxyribonuclease VII large subunit [Alphaproteobacteria bacterium]
MNDKINSNVAEFTVSELSHAVKRTVEDAFGLVRLRGEISGFRGRHSSGHAYFSLKDERAKIDAVVWKGIFNSLKFKPEEGVEVIATGRITTFPGKSSYQIIIEALEPAGIGALMALLEERKKKLAAEGLFDEARKRPLPFLPRVVGIVTSPTGAVIRDMLHGFAERFPAQVFVWPVRVQGETCAPEVAAAVTGFNALAEGGLIPRPDVLIVARGGGSLEDLWGFNEEIVARAVADSTIPVISAVGHETDWTLIDLVSDARAPTPTKAAEWAVPKHSELITRMAELRERQRLAVARAMEGRRSALRAASRGLPRPQELLAFARQRFDAGSGRLGYALRAFAGEKRARFERWGGRLDTRLIVHRIERGGERLSGRHRELLQMTRRFVERRRSVLDRHGARLRPELLAHPARHRRERLEQWTRRARICVSAAVETRQRRLDGMGQLLASLSHKSVLERGFALVRDANGNIVRRVGDARAAGQVELEFRDGRVAASVNQASAGGRDGAGQKDSSASDASLSVATNKEKKSSSRKSEGKSAAGQGRRSGQSSADVEQNTMKDRQGQLF